MSQRPANEYPNLFKQVICPWGPTRARFELLQNAPPYHRPHQPFPEYYRVVGVGRVELVTAPENPAGAEKVVRIECVALKTLVKRFRSSGRHDLAEVYLLASEIPLETEGNS